MTKLQTMRPYLIGAAGACAVLALGLSQQVHAVAAAFVSVTNTSANPVPISSVDERVTRPFGTRTFPNVRAYSSFTVPADKRLVITSVSGFNNGNGSLSDIEVSVAAGGVGVAQRFPFGAQQSVNALRYLQSESVFLVADPGSTVYFFANDSDFNDSAGVNVDVKGYYTAAN
ncbi:MAG: hypothetical protein ABIR54_00235 [Burkholderiaceae bacterium]